MSDSIEHTIKTIIIETLNLEDMEPEDIQANEPLLGTGMQLDSIDALELVVRIEKAFGIKIKNSEEAKSALQTVASLEAFVRARQAES